MSDGDGRLTLIRAASLIDGNGSPPLKRAALLIEGHRITAVGTEEAVIQVEGTSVHEIDYEDKTVYPGLIDCHDHLIGMERSEWEISGFLEGLIEIK